MSSRYINNVNRIQFINYIIGYRSRDNKFKISFAHSKLINDNISQSYIIINNM